MEREVAKLLLRLSEVDRDERSQSTEALLDIVKARIKDKTADNVETLSTSAAVEARRARLQMLTGKYGWHMLQAYVLDRLVKGCGSSQEASHQGYGAAILAFLREFRELKPDQVWDLVTSEHVIVDEPLNLRQAQIARVLVISALVKSRRHLEDVTLSCTLFSELLQLELSQPNLSALATAVATELCNSFGSDAPTELKKIVLDSFSIPMAQWRPIQLTLALRCGELGWAKSVEKILTPANYAHVAGVLLAASASYPVTHPVWTELRRSLGSSEDGPHDVKVGLLREFYSELVDPLLLHSSLVVKSEVLKLSSQMLHVVPDDQVVDCVPIILSPGLIRLLMRILRRPDVKLHSHCVSVLTKLESEAARRGQSFAVAVLRSLFGPCGSFTFDKDTKSTVAATMLRRLSSDGFGSLLHTLFQWFADPTAFHADDILNESQRAQIIHDMISFQKKSPSNKSKNSLEESLDEGTEDDADDEEEDEDDQEEEEMSLEETSNEVLETVDMTEMSQVRIRILELMGRLLSSFREALGPHIRALMRFFLVRSCLHVTVTPIGDKKGSSGKTKNGRGQDNNQGKRSEALPLTSLDDVIFTDCVPPLDGKTRAVCRTKLFSVIQMFVAAATENNASSGAPINHGRRGVPGHAGAVVLSRQNAVETLVDELETLTKYPLESNGNKKQFTLVFEEDAVDDNDRSFTSPNGGGPLGETLAQCLALAHRARSVQAADSRGEAVATVTRNLAVEAVLLLSDPAAQAGDKDVRWAVVLSDWAPDELSLLEAGKSASDTAVEQLLSLLVEIQNQASAFERDFSKACFHILVPHLSLNHLAILVGQVTQNIATDDLEEEDDDDDDDDENDDGDMDEEESEVGHSEKREKKMQGSNSNSDSSEEFSESTSSDGETSSSIDMTDFLRQEEEQDLKDAKKKEKKDGNVTSDSSDSEGMTDEQMFALDNQLAAAFKSTQKAKALTVSQFHYRSRVIDFLELFLQRRGLEPGVLRVLAPLIDLVARRPLGGGRMQQRGRDMANLQTSLLRRVQGLVLKHICQGSTTKGAIFERGEYAELLTAVFGYCRSRTLNRAVAYGLVHFALKRLLAIGGSDNPVQLRELATMVAAAWRQFLTKRSSSIDASSLLQPLAQKFPKLAWAAAPAVLDTAVQRGDRLNPYRMREVLHYLVHCAQQTEFVAQNPADIRPVALRLLPLMKAFTKRGSIPWVREVLKSLVVLVGTVRRQKVLELPGELAPLGDYLHVLASTYSGSAPLHDQISNLLRGLGMTPLPKTPKAKKSKDVNSKKLENPPASTKSAEQKESHAPSTLAKLKDEEDPTKKESSLNSDVSKEASVKKGSKGKEHKSGKKEDSAEKKSSKKASSLKKASSKSHAVESDGITEKKRPREEEDKLVKKSRSKK